MESLMIQEFLVEESYFGTIDESDKSSEILSLCYKNRLYKP